MSQAMTQAEMDTLESMMDRRGARNVLRAIAQVCDDKAGHIATNWQDRTLARRWSGIAVSLESTADKAISL